MNMPKITRKIFAVILIAAWASYALLNFFERAPYLSAKFQRGWSIASKLQEIVNTANGTVLYHETLQDAYGRLTNLLGKQTSNNFTVVKGDNQELSYTNFYRYETYSHYDAPALQMRELNTAAKKQGATLLYLNCLDLYNDGNDVYGKFPVSNFNSRADAFLYDLHGYGVDYLDAREVLAKSKLTEQEYRYKTEPHWTVQAAFEVYLGLLEKLNKQGGKINKNAQFAKKDSFLQTVYPQGYVGKIGKSTGVTFSGYDDFTLIVPRFATDLTISYLERDKKPSKRGNFSEVLLEKRFIDAENIYERDMYSAYLSEGYPYRKIQNNLNPTGPKILVIGDSYMLPVTTFLATAASEVYMLWPYGLPESKASMIEYIEDNEFDHIIVGMSPMSLYTNGFNFLKGIELPKIEQPVKQQ